MKQLKYFLPETSRFFQKESESMKDHEITAIVNQLRDIAIDFHGAQQLRSRIQECIVDPLRELQRAKQHIANMDKALAELQTTMADVLAVLNRAVDAAAASPAPKPIDVLREVQALADKYIEGEFRSGWECACDEFHERLKNP